VALGVQEKGEMMKKTQPVTNKTTISYKAMMKSKKLDSFIEEEPDKL
jgi:hypothetical protein